MLRYALLFGLLLWSSCTPPEPCIAQCGERVCGPDPVCGEPCGSCFDDEVCSDTGTCDVICDTAACDAAGCVYDLDVDLVELTANIEWTNRPASPLLALFPSHEKVDDNIWPRPIDIAGGKVPAGVWDVYAATSFLGPMVPVARHLVLSDDTTLPPHAIRGARIAADPGFYVLREPGTHRLLATLRTEVADRVSWDDPPRSYLPAWQGVFDVFYAREANDWSGMLRATSEQPLVEGFVVDSVNGARLPSLPLGRYAIDVTWNGEPVSSRTWIGLPPQQPVGTFDVPVEHDHGWFLARDIVVQADQTNRVTFNFEAPTIAVELAAEVTTGVTGFTLPFIGYDDEGTRVSEYRVRMTGGDGVFRGQAQLPLGTYNVNGNEVLVDGAPMVFNWMPVAVSFDVAFDGVSQPDIELVFAREERPDTFPYPNRVRSGAVLDVGRYRVILNNRAVIADNLLIDAQHTAFSFDVDVVTVSGAWGQCSSAIVGDVSVQPPAGEATYELVVPVGQYDVDIICGNIARVGNCVVLDDGTSP